MEVARASLCVCVRVLHRYDPDGSGELTFRELFQNLRHTSYVVKKKKKRVAPPAEPLADLRTLLHKSKLDLRVLQVRTSWGSPLLTQCASRTVPTLHACATMCATLAHTSHRVARAPPCVDVVQVDQEVLDWTRKTGIGPANPSINMGMFAGLGAGLKGTVRRADGWNTEQ